MQTDLFQPEEFFDSGDKSHRQAPVTSNAGSSLKPETDQPQTTELQIEAVELASNFLMRTQLHNPKIVSRPETPLELVSYGAAWKSEEASGFVGIHSDRA